MIGKYTILFFFFTVFAAAQASPAQYEVIENYDEEVIYGFWSKVKEILQNIKNAVGNIGEKIAQIFKDLQNKINKIISGLNENKIVQAIIQKIKEIVGQAGEKVNACIEKQRPAIEALAEEIRTASMKCVEAAQKQTIPIQERTQDLINKAAAIKGQVTSSAAKCFKENILHPSQMVACFKTEIGNITETIKELQKEAKKLAADAFDVSMKASQELKNCMTAVTQQANVKQQAIAEDIQKCIKA